jgi:hypothetical protein
MIASPAAQPRARHVDAETAAVLPSPSYAETPAHGSTMTITQRGSVARPMGGWRARSEARHRPVRELAFAATHATTAGTACAAKRR